MDHASRVTGVVLAGGASRRMGVDKRSVVVDGAPMLVRATRAVAAVADVVIIACRRGDPPDPAVVSASGARIVHDRHEHAGPLAGLEAGLAASETDLTIVVAVDMPWVSVSVLRYLVELAQATPGVDAVLVQTDDGPEPLLAVYRQTALGAASQLLETGERRLMALLAVLHVRYVPPCEWQPLDPTGLTVANINEIRDLNDDRP